MKKGKEHYKNLDVIRAIACIAILLYHLKIVKGGYLAVCTFFVLSGYLSCVSAFKKGKLNVLDYYVNRLKKIYLPVAITVFISISVISLMNVNWLNLKPETRSVLFGYNNFWQLNASMDYFARHVSSPFMHFWYIAILLQYDLIFPILFNFLYLERNKISKKFQCVLIISASILFTGIFCFFNLTHDLMSVYYNTFTRIFSLLYGLALGFLHSYYGNVVPERLKKNIVQTVFYILLTIMLGFYVFVDVESSFYAFSMIFVSFLTCVLIDFGTIQSDTKASRFDNDIQFISGISYEVYLVQYPIIFVLQTLNITGFFYYIFTFILVILIACLLHYSLNKSKWKWQRILVFCVSICFAIHGCFTYLITEDHTKEMNALKDQLEENEKLVARNSENYAAQLQKENEELEGNLAEIENKLNDLNNVVTNLPITAIGDSVMLGCITNLSEQFPNGYIDAQKSRTAYVVTGILNDLSAQNMLGDTIVIGLGTNGDVSFGTKQEIMNACGDREVYWINTVNYPDANVALADFATSYSNLHIIDWYSISSGHPDYFWADGIHLATEEGKQAYTQAIYDAIYQNYYDKLSALKQNLTDQYDSAQRNKITFYGNGLLLNAFGDMQSTYQDAQFVVDENFNFDTLYQKIKQSIEDGTITNKIVISVDNSCTLTLEEYQKLISLCNEKELYILSMNETTNKVVGDHVKIIDFYQTLQAHPDYIMVDGEHLSEAGNLAMAEMMKNSIEQ